MVKCLVQDIFLKAMQQLAVSPNHKIAVATSGGSDSLALTLLANTWAKARIIAITVDHALRKESEYEAAQVARWLAKYNIEHHILKWEGDKKSTNIQANARNARYELMTNFCKQNQIANLLVAHTLEDQAETVLIRLMRGSGLEGLCGMKDDVMINDIRILRPLLVVKKEQLQSYLRLQKQGWIEDPSNQNDKFTRVQIRKFINNASEPELLVSRLADTANALKRSNEYIEQKIYQEMQEVVSFQPEGYCFLDIEKFKSLHVESAFKILAKLIKTIGGEYYKPRFEKLENLYNLIKNDKYQATLGGCEIFLSKRVNQSGKIVIVKEKSALQEDVCISSGSSIIWDGRFKCSLKYLSENIETITKPLDKQVQQIPSLPEFDKSNSGNDARIVEGKYDNFKVGAIGSSELLNIVKERQQFKNLKLPKKIIYALPALKILENIVAVPHIGYYRDKKFEGLFKAEFII